MSEAYAQIHLNETTVEEWRPVVGFEDVYEVSSHGRVRRILDCRGSHAGRIFTGTIDDTGYYRIRLTRDGTKVLKRIHVLVCEGFHGIRPVGYVCNHLDGIKTHNVPSNLEWTTFAENVQHAHRTGLVPAPKGEMNGRAILTCEQAREIRRRYADGDALQRELGKEFGVTQRTISNIVLGKQWAHC